MFFFTSESVSSGHPDKIADQISDLILDHFLERDAQARVAAETFVTPKRIVVAGEIRSNYTLDTNEIECKIRELIKEIGYINGTFSYDSVKIEINLTEQSPDIARGVDEGDKHQEGAGDQGLMFGYACKETEDFMPAPAYYSHQVLRNIYENVRLNKISGFGPDAKTQLTFKYVNGKPVALKTVLVSIQHEEALSQTEIERQIKPIIITTIPQSFLQDTRFIFNPTGKFVIGGPEGDVGLTGRKIIVDTYGGSAPHGGGAFSGKDPTKVDRSAAYIARYLAKNVVASGLAQRCLIQLSYGIGIAEPISFYLNSFGTSKIEDTKIADYLMSNLDLTPKGIRTRLQLNKPIYLATATYGHFGRKYRENTGLFTWENMDLSRELQVAFLQKEAI